MASFGSVNQKQKRNYHRLVELNTTCAGFVLRKYLEHVVNKSGLTLQQYLERSKDLELSIERLSSDQRSAFEKCRYEEFDNSLLILIIKKTCTLDDERIEKAVETLRVCRNTIAHTISGGITGNKDFNKASEAILAIAGEIGSDVQKKVSQQINEIHNTELVRTQWNLEKIQMNGEILMAKLVSDDGDAGKLFKVCLA